NDAARTYGDANPVFTGVVSGLVNGDTAAGIGLDYSTTATAASPVSNPGYAITASLAKPGNYRLESSVAGMLTITPAPLTVTIDPATRRYGDADPVFTYTLAGLRNGDSADLVIVANLDSLATPTANAGSYTIVGFPF